MKLKYYLRGVGIGIIVTAILMGLNHSGQKEKITNDEIISRAKELGMYESIVVSDTTSNNLLTETISDNEAVEIVSENETDTTVSENETDTTVENNEVIDTVSENAVEDTESENNDSSSDNENNTDDGTEPAEVVITINSGEGSLSVSKKLELAGLIEDAATYDAYLAANGYDKRIKTGNHVIPTGISGEEIAKIISSK